jgi:opacity protein-like surface antigen
MKKFLLAAAATALLGASAAFAQVVVRVAPPAPIVERHPVAPGPRYVWTDGYHRWDGHRYVWVSGRWVMPPRAGVVWVPGHWDARPGGWVWIGGHWR